MKNKFTIYLIIFLLALSPVGAVSLHNAVRLSSQQQLNSLQGALNTATLNGIKYDQLITVEGWELKLSPPRLSGGLPTVIHARPIK